MSKRETALPLTMSVPQFARLVFDIGLNSAYAAAERGDIPTILMGGKKRVPVRIALRQLAGDDAALLEAITRDLLIKLEKAAAWMGAKNAARPAADVAAHRPHDDQGQQIKGFKQVDSIEQCTDAPQAPEQLARRHFHRRVIATVVPDRHWPEMWRVQLPGSHLSDMVNLTRAKDAAIALAGGVS
jgi:hypothetical protein